MKKRFLLITLIMCFLCMGGGKISELKAQEEVVTIGNGTNTSKNYPINTKQNYSISQQLYTNEVLSALPNNAIIKSIAFYNKYGDKNDRDIVLYLKNVTSTSITTFENLSDDDKMYEGTINTYNYDSGEDKMFELKLQKEFHYEGSGLIICVYDKTGNNHTSKYQEEFLHTSNLGKTLYAAGSVAYNVANLSGETCRSSNYANNLEITYTASSTPSVPTAPDAPVITSPENEATDVFNPALKFTLGSNTSEYKIMMGEGTSEMTDLTGWEKNDNKTVSYQTSGLLSNTTYSWKVVARTSDGSTGYLTTESETYSFTTKNVTDAPGVISNISPEDNAEVDNNPVLSWTFGENTESYKVLFAKEGEELSAIKDWTPTNNAESASFKTSEIYLHGEWQNPGLDANATYNWQIITKNIIGETESETFSFTKRGAPDNVTPIFPEDGATDVISPVLSWTFAPNTTHYRVSIDFGNGGYEYVAGSNTTWLEVNGNTASFDTKDIRKNELTPLTTYSWAIDVKNNDAGERTVHGKNVTTFSFTTANIIPVKYTAPAENSIMTTNEATLEWSYGAKNEATHYQVLVGAGEESDMKVVKDWTERKQEGTGLEGTGSYTIENLTAGTKYYWQVNVKEGEKIAYGEICTFISILSAPQNLKADPEIAYPTTSELYQTATVTVMWDLIDNVAGYNVYVDDEKYNAELVTSSSLSVSNLGYSKEGHRIQVTAYYEGLGESEKSEAVIVKVAGYSGNINGTISGHNNVALANAKVKFDGVDEFGMTKSYEFSTDENGFYGGRIVAGTYTVSVEAEGYELFTQNNIVIAKDEAKVLNYSLKSNYAFTVTLQNVTFETIDIVLSNDDWEDARPGNYDVYLKQNDNTNDSQSLYFSIIMQGASAIRNSSYNDWAGLKNGTYQIGVAVQGSDFINWSKEVTRDYNIFEKDGDITDADNWRDGLPEHTEDIYIKAAATLASGDENTFNDVTITNSGSLTINGKLTANNVYNKSSAANMCINDGGQLVQNNTNLNGKFVMNLNNPEKWNVTKDGWQFISSPVIDASISAFVPNANYFDYDLYRYDGTQELEWINHKSETEFEDTFVEGRGYLASYEKDPMGEFESQATFSGVLNSAKTHSWTFSFAEETESLYANFHLLGNPFTFEMDMNQASFTGLVEGIAVINEKGDGYTYDATTIPVGDGFFVKVTGENASLSYGNATRGSRNEKANSLNIVATGKAGKDNVVINFVGASEGFDKLQNFNEDIATVYVKEDGKRYGIYNCGADVQEVALSFSANQMGSYTIAAQPNGEFEMVTLVDRATGVETNLLLEDYTFAATSNDNPDRFIIRLTNGQQSTVDSHFVYQSGEELILNIQGEVQIVDVLGRVVYHNEMANDINRINVSAFNSGAYMVKVINGNEVKVEKIIL